MWQTIIWFLIFGVLFYLLMRMGGCGMHSHGGHEKHEGHGDHKEPDKHDKSE